MRSDSKSLQVVWVLGLVAGLAACSGGGGTPTSMPVAPLVLSDAAVVVGGQSVGGMTLPQGHGQGMSTRFQGRVQMDGRPAPGAQLWMKFERPGGMMGSSGMIGLFDDGTHGDRMAGDGEYCFEDTEGSYGCHASGSPMGEYHYEFWATRSGQESQHERLTVTIAGR